MTGFEPRISGIGSNHSTNWATQPLPKRLVIVYIWAVENAAQQSFDFNAVCSNPASTYVRWTDEGLKTTYLPTVATVPINGWEWILRHTFTYYTARRLRRGL